MHAAIVNSEPEKPSLHWLALTDEQLSDLRNCLADDIAQYGNEDNSIPSVYAKVLRLCGEMLN